MGSILADVTSLLFRFRPVVFEQGRLVFQVGLPGLIGAGIVIAAAFSALVAYRRREGVTPVKGSRWLFGLRIAALMLLLFCLLRPALVVSRIVPQQNFLGIVMDDSRSMRLPGEEEVFRGAWAAEMFNAEDGDLRRRLQDRFRLRFFGFSDRTDRVEGPEHLSLDGTRTDLATALETARSDLASVPLAGLVVVSDGADNGTGSLTDALARLRGAGVPVYTVGVGSEQFEKDIEVERVEAPDQVLKGSSVGADLVIRQSGYDGRPATLVVEANGRIVEQRTITLPRQGRTSTVRAHFEADEAGPVRYRFTVRAPDDEEITQNNVREALVMVRDDTERVLYFEGEPRFELKFIRRAVEEDENLRVIALQQTGENKYLRLGELANEADLATGFPVTREELFAYKALILGSVPASYFAPDQLQMIADFVSQRGGSLLLLGGRNALAEGGFKGTPIEELIPVALPAFAPGGIDAEAFEIKAVPTPAGRLHPITRLHTDDAENRQAWEKLPPLTTVNRLGVARAGATTLLSGRPVRGGRDEPLLVHQRYGRGRSLLFAAQDTWLWQMHADIPLEDMTHENLWRQIVRWMVNDVPDRVQLPISAVQAIPGEEVTIQARVEDERYLGMNDTDVDAFITAPDSTVTVLKMDWDVREDGVYRGRFTPSQEGLHAIHIEAVRDSQYVGGAAGWLSAHDSNEEFFGAEMRAPLLQRISEETGGRFYTPSNARDLLQDVEYTEAGITVHETLDLWDLPAVFLLFLLLLAAEWFARRRRGLP